MILSRGLDPDDHSPDQTPNLPITELYVLLILLGLMGQIAPPSSLLDLEGPPFWEEQAHLARVSQGRRNSYSVTGEPRVESALCYLCDGLRGCQSH